MNRRAPGIPTLYANVRFRSRLEARWAAFFDELGWPWEYEPIDLAGYIPDFVLRFHKPLLVEVKPEFEIAALHRYTRKIEDSGWRRQETGLDEEALIVGANLFTSGECDVAAIGLLLQSGVADSWDEAIFFRCGVCGKPSLHHSTHCWSCRVTGCYQGGDHIGRVEYAEALATWRRASNRAQWQRSWGIV
jgi:hypothetical protein